MTFVCIIVICTPWAFMDQDCWGLPDKNPKEQYVLFEATNDLGFLAALVVKNLPAGVWTLGWEDPLEEEITTHCSILSWEIPWTEGLGGSLYMGLQKSRTQLMKLSFIS